MRTLLEEHVLNLSERRSLRRRLVVPLRWLTTWTRRLAVELLCLLLEPPTLLKYCDKLERYEPHNPRNEPPNAPPPRIF